MMSKGLTSAFLLLFAVFLTGCSLSPLFGQAEAPLIVVSSAPENPPNTPTPSPEEPLPNDALGTLEEGTPSSTDQAEAELPTEIATTTALLKVPTPTPTPPPTPAPERPKLEIKSSSIKLSDDGQKYLIEGQLFNGGKSTVDLTNFKLVAHLYDRQEKVLASALGRPTPTNLYPQSSTTFKITVDYIAGVDTYKVQGGY